MRTSLAIPFILILLAGCRPAAPVPTVAPSPSPTPTAAVPVPATSTPAPTATPAQTATSLPEGMRTFIFPHYETLAVAYDPSLWQADKGMGQGLLASSTISGCEISDTSPDAPPEPLYAAHIGSLDYQTTRQQVGDQLAVSWYFAPPELSSKAPQSLQPVYLLVTSPLASEADCTAAAQPVLASLAASGIP